MKKTGALVLSLLITLLVATNFYFFSLIKSNDAKEVVVISRVIDGDTLVLDDERTIRLININSPEKNLPQSLLATNFLKQFEGKTVILEITGVDKYHRFLGKLFSLDGEYLNLVLVQKGLASKFLVQQSELKTFYNAEKEAIENHQGIWKVSQYSSCIDIDIDKNSEVALIENDCSINSLKGFTVKDESRKIYTFKDLDSRKIALHTEHGSDNVTDIFWNSAQSIWNNDRDSAYLFDNEGGLAAYAVYGY